MSCGVFAGSRSDTGQFAQRTIDVRSPVRPRHRGALRRYRGRAQLRTTDAITRKLNSITFPKIEFQDATVREAFEFLVTKAKALDPSGAGVNIVLKLDPSPDSPVPLDQNSADPRLTGSLSDVSLLEAMQYIVGRAKLKLRIEPFAIAIVPKSDVRETFVWGIWKLDAAMQAALGIRGGRDADIFNMKDNLQSRGLKFPHGAMASWTPVTQRLEMYNTPENIERVNHLIEPVPAPAPVRPGL